MCAGNSSDGGVVAESGKGVKSSGDFRVRACRDGSNGPQLVGRDGLLVRRPPALPLPLPLPLLTPATSLVPARAVCLHGGRQSRTSDEYGHIFDHFGLEYRSPDDRFAMSMCRQQAGTTGTSSRERNCDRGPHLLL